MDYDQTDIARTYKLGRDHGPAILQMWMDVIAAQVEPERVSTVLDLGCGTGRYSEGLATRLNAAVVGVDPSRKMLAEAVRHLTNPRVAYVCGTAEALPLRDNSVDVVFISMVFHHFTDAHAVARECRRVLRDRGRVLLRTACSEKIPTYPYVPYFPASIPVLEQRLPSLRFQREVFKAVSFAVLLSTEVTQELAEDYSTYADKLATRSD